MRTVGLRELKNRLGVYMRRVREGEAVAITDRGRIVAELGPPRTEQNPLSALQAMARGGEITLAKRVTGRKRAALYAPLAKVLRGVESRDLLDAERGER